MFRAVTAINGEGQQVVLKACPSSVPVMESPYFFWTACGQLWAFIDGRLERMWEARLHKYRDGVEFYNRRIQRTQHPVKPYHTAPIHYRYHLVALDGETGGFWEMLAVYRNREKACIDMEHLRSTPEYQGKTLLVIDRLTGAHDV